MKKLFLSLLVFSSFFAFGQTIHPHYEDGHLYLKIKEDAIDFRGLDGIASAAAFRQMLGEEINLAGVMSFERMFAATKHPGLDNIFRIRIADPAGADAAVRILSGNPNVAYAEKVPLKKFFYVPNDTLYNNSNQWNLFKINAALAWNYVIPSAQSVIAVIDEGIDIFHPDLAANIWQNSFEIPNDGIDNDGNFYIDDLNSWDFGDGDNSVTPLDSTWNHGTHVAGVAAAVSDNTTGIASIGFNCRIMAVKGSSSNVFMSNGYEAIAYAAENGADVINLSWGGPAYSFTEESVINFAVALNVVVVAASGNSGTDQVNYPAGYNRVISVASTGQNDVRAFSSNYGPSIDLCAPGINILSTVTGGGYGLKTGTSMAAPLVAGLAGLMRSYHPEISVQDLENCLKNTADNVDFMNPNFFGLLGAGRINAFNAMSCVAASRFRFDVWVEELSVPDVWSCNPVISPMVKIKNHGTDTLTQFEYHYRFDQGPFISGIWTGSAGYDSVLYLQLPIQSFGSGEHTFTFYTSWPNQQVDWNLYNDTLNTRFSILPAGLNPPFHESFEDTSSTRGLWSFLNPDGSKGWQFDNLSVSGMNRGLAWINLFNYSATGEKDGLLTPPLNLYGLDSAWISFNYASRTNYFNSSIDTLKIFVSQDCGATYLQPIFIIPLDANFSTSNDTSNTFFRANTNDQWCDSLLSTSCFKLDLTPFIGQQNLIVKIEMTNMGGNNFYLDDFQFNGTQVTGSAPQPQISLSQSQACQGEVITMSASSVPPASSWRWVVPGALPDTVFGQIACFQFPATGLYSVELSAFNQAGSGVATLSNSVLVNALPLAEIISDSNIVCLGDSLMLSAPGVGTFTWFSDGILSSDNGSSVFLLGVNPGNYSVSLLAVSPEGCSVNTEQDFIVTSCLGLLDVESQKMWAAYYDQNSKGIHFSRESIEDGVIDLFSISGQKIINVIVPKGSLSTFVNTDTWAPGIYFLRYNSSTLKIAVY